MLFKKCQIIFFNNILLVTSTPCQQAEHSVRHVGYFRWLVDDKDDFKNDFIFLGMKFATKSIFELKWKLTQNIGTKSAFSPKKTKMTQSQINEKSVKIYEIQQCLNT